MNFDQDILLQSIEKIDNDPTLRLSRTSSTYDLSYKGNLYPPILVLSVASQLNGGKELFLKDFNNSIEIPFKILKNNGFEIVKKESSYYNELVDFIEQSKTDNLKYSKYSKTFLDLDVKVSFGQGVVATIPWISFLRDGITTSNGIYPVYLYFKKENLLILSYGISETNNPTFFWPDSESLETIEDYFTKNNLGKPFRYGKSFIYKVYDTENLPEKEIIDKDLIGLLAYYKSLEFDNSVFLNIKEMDNFSYKSFLQFSKESNLNFSTSSILRFIASLTSKPFVILSGLSGSGKTKIAQSFALWICESESQYKIVPVGADWTNREPLVGYPNGLKTDEYITPDSGVIHLLLEATSEGNENKPFFLILDEMNLSHVERYFADFLSIMESRDKIKLYTGEQRISIDGKEIPQEIGWPKNVFIIGTVNIDETTYMFSPKVLDRANVIEFRITEDEIKTYLANPGVPDLTKLERQGISMAESFLSISTNEELEKNENLTTELVLFFNQLKNVGAEFGYRSATEILQLVSKLKTLEPTLQDNQCLDIAIMQKLLPKLHGSRSKIVKILIALLALCVEDISNADFEKKYDDLYKNSFDGIKVKYPISFEKLTRMYKNVLENGFTSYAEA